MRKWKVVLSLLLVLIFISSPGLAVKRNNITVSMDGKRYTVRQVPIIMDGQAVNMDIPTFIHKDYTFVPIRFMEHYGAKVDWEQKTKTATISLKNKEIKLTINSRDVYINGEKKVVDSTLVPKFVTFLNKDTRTMVPFRLVSETLGYKVGWDNDKQVPFINKPNSTGKGDKDENINTREITNLSIEKGSTDKPKVIISGTEKLNYSTVKLENPNRLVIDIEDAKLNLKDNIAFEGGVGSINVDRSPISKVNISQFSITPDVVRIVVHLTDEADFNIVSGNEGKNLILSSINKVGKVEKEIINGKEALVIKNVGEVKTNIIKLKNPERIVVDFMDSSLEGGNYFEYNYDIGFIKGIRISQFIPDNLYKPNDRIVRMVLDIKDGISDPDIKIDKYDNKIVITPESSIWELIDYSLEGNERIISIHANRETDYDIYYDSNGKTMTIDIPSRNVDLEEDFVNIRDGLINDITVKELGRNTKIILSFRRGAEYSVLSRELDDRIVISLKRDENIKPSDMLIVIDPGHGGKDPGAVQNGVREKDVNLSVSQKLDKGLKDKGYSTIMTRKDDNYVDLYERANIANNIQADIFISLHANSIVNKDISGIQVLYCPADQCKLKQEDDYPLAKIIMEELVKGTGAQDKGIIKRPNLVVLNKTSMPAVLIELGFLTNPNEAKLLSDDAYQELLAESIIRGIERYFETY